MLDDAWPPERKGRILSGESAEPAVDIEIYEPPTPLELPLEVFALVIEKLDNVEDFCNVAQVCRAWRALIHSLDVCWERAFIDYFGDLLSFSYTHIPSWREKYM